MRPSLALRLLLLLLAGPACWASTPLLLLLLLLGASYNPHVVSGVCAAAF